MSLTTTIQLKTRGVLRLSRWKEYLPFIVPSTLFGALLAAQPNNIPLDWRLIAVMAANTLANAYAFMINDIEDAPDDAREAHRASKNAITNGELTPLQGWFASGLVAIASLVLYLLAGFIPLIVGVLTLTLSHLYSWRVVRLKKWPVTDVVSHSLMLGGLIVVAGFVTYAENLGWAWLMVLAITLISAYGQLYNQVRDFEMDKAAGLYNTSIMVGERVAKLLMRVSLGAAIILLLSSFVIGLIPLWLLVIPAVLIPVFALLYRQRNDARGTKALDITGNMQSQFLIMVNVVVIVWLVALIFR